MPATAVDHEHRVTPRELFFDLVFVFAFTQATLLANDPTFADRAGRWCSARSGGPRRRTRRPTTSSTPRKASSAQQRCLSR